MRDVAYCRQCDRHVNVLEGARTRSTCPECGCLGDWADECGACDGTGTVYETEHPMGGGVAPQAVVASTVPTRCRHCWTPLVVEVPLPDRCPECGHPADWEVAADDAGQPCPTCVLVGAYCGGSGHPSCGEFRDGVPVAKLARCRRCNDVRDVTPHGLRGNLGVGDMGAPGGQGPCGDCHEWED